MKHVKSLWGAIKHYAWEYIRKKKPNVADKVRKRGSMSMGDEI